MKVKPNHPLTELLARILSSIEVVPAKEQRRMANRACREATRWHREQVKKLELWICHIEDYLRTSKGMCPECYHRLGLGKHHAKDCELFLLVSRIRREMGSDS